MVVGSFISRVLPLVSFLIFDQIDNQKKRIKIFSLIIFMSTIIIILSGERLSLFYLILFTLIFLLYVDIKYKYILYSLIIILLYALISSSTVLRDRIYQQTYSQIIKTDGSMNFFSAEHQSHAISALKIFKDNPIIGIGPKNYRYECRKEKYNVSINSCTSHPHNFYIQLLSETGILGILIPLIILINIFKYFLKTFYKKITQKGYDPEIKNIYLYVIFNYFFSYYTNWKYF